MTERRYEFVFRHGVPSDQQRRSVTDTAAVVAPGAVVGWDHDRTGRLVGVNVDWDIGDVDPLEAFAVLVQVFNSATVWVAGWPPQTQTCTPVYMGGVSPVAHGAVGVSLVALS